MTVEGPTYHSMPPNHQEPITGRKSHSMAAQVILRLSQGLLGCPGPRELSKGQDDAMLGRA